LDDSIEPGVKYLIVRRMTQKNFSGIDDVGIIRLLSDQDERVRRNAALKCLQALNKTRVKRLLHSYLSRDQQHHYSSIHWLDLGASMPRDVVEKATKFELEDRPQ
jgi:hypothetical protein